MKMLINVNLDNAAFEDGGTDEARRAICAGLEKIRGAWPTAGEVRAPIMDINGNNAGFVEVVA